MRANKVGRLVADIEIQTLRAQPFHFMVDGPRHDIARGQFLTRVEILHEAAAIRQQQHAAFAAHRLGNQK